MELSQTVVFCLPIALGLFIVTANLLSLITIARFRSLWQPCNIYMASLALIDLLLGLAYVLSVVIVKLRLAGPSTNTACLALSALVFVGLQASLLTSAVVSVDRFVCTTFPYFYERRVSNRLTVLIALAVWPLAFCLGLLVRFPPPTWPITASTPCQYLPTSSRVLQLCTSGVCLSCCGVLYSLVSRVALRHLKKVAMQRVIACAEHVPLRESFMQKVKAVKMFLVSFCLLFVFFLPLNVAHLLAVLNIAKSEGTRDVLFFLAFCNSLANVFVYLLLNKAFRKRFKKNLKMLLSLGRS